MTVALIVAAGSGERLGAARPKALVELAGKPMLQWSIEALREAPAVGRIVVALPVDAELPDGCAADERVVAIAGGASRSESVRNAMAAAGEDETVLVHDAARPLLTAPLAEAVIAGLLANPGADGAIAAAPVSDTIKRADERMIVTETLPRSELWAVQTPQVFRADALTRAHRVSTQELAGATDDARLIERAGGRIVVVPAPSENIKVTTPVDLELAALLLARRANPA
ncbi:MAG: 2-C-methyl-D-erythritol 4-phosphate cytidylyltransferase [Solirubrobacteraceae bacterium]